jgi:4-amino-4-deoxy-L-arabinose transferase-like glycosyltransferase
MKRFMTRSAVIIVPLVVLYLGVGWNLKGGIFRPAQKVRSIISPPEDTEEESSNVERDIENFNLLKSWEANMVFGQGFGHAFTEFLPSNDFAQSNFGHVGHNSILWLLWIGGIVGLTCVLLYLGIAAFFFARTLRRATAFDDRVALLTALCIMLTYLLQAFGDMGTEAIPFDFFIAVALAIIGRLTARLGGWPAPPAMARLTPVG